MTIDSVSNIIAKACEVVVLTSAPTVGVALIVGVVIAIFQAITQIQEQTITFVPKMILVFIVLIFTFPWMAKVIINWTESLWLNMIVYSK